MIGFSFSSNVLHNLIEITKNNKCDWIRISILKTYLRNKELSMSDIPCLHLFLKYLQKDRFLFDCMESYITHYQKIIYVLSKSKYTYEYRVDILSMDEGSSNWYKLNSSSSAILRLRNAVVVTNENDDCEKFISSISSNCVV